MRKIRFSGFPPRLKDEASLRTLFSTFGSVTRLGLNSAATTENDQPDVSGTCTFSDADEAAMTAASLNGLKIGDNVVKVEREDNGAGEDQTKKEEKKKKPKPASDQTGSDIKVKKVSSASNSSTKLKPTGESIGKNSSADAKRELSAAKKRDLVDGEPSEEKKKAKKLKPAATAGAETVKAKADTTSEGVLKKQKLEAKTQTSVPIEGSEMPKVKKQSSDGGGDGEKKKTLKSQKEAPESLILKKKKMLEAPAILQRSSSSSHTSEAGAKPVKKSEPELTRSVSSSTASKLGASSKEKQFTEERGKKSDVMSDKDKNKLVGSLDAEKKKTVIVAESEKVKPPQGIPTSSVALKKVKDEPKKDDSEKTRPLADAGSAKPSKPVGGLTKGPQVDAKHSTETKTPLGTVVGAKGESKVENQPLPVKPIQGGGETKIERPASASSSNTDDRTRQKEIAIAAAKSAVSSASSASVQDLSIAKPPSSREMGTEPPVATVPSADGELWEEYLDETYGVNYYFNPATGVTTWDHPPAGARIVKGVVEGSSESQDAFVASSQPPSDFKEPPASPLKSHDLAAAISVAGRRPHVEVTNLEGRMRGDELPIQPKPSPASATIVPVHDSAAGGGKPFTASMERPMPSNTTTSGVVAGGSSPQLISSAELERKRGETLTGVITHVKNFYGFIRCHPTPSFYLKEDMFFHFDELVPAYPNPKPGDEVEFEIGFNMKRRQPIATGLRRQGMKAPPQTTPVVVSPAPSPSSSASPVPVSHSTLPPAVLPPATVTASSIAAPRHLPLSSTVSNLPSAVSGRSGSFASASGAPPQPFASGYPPRRDSYPPSAMGGSGNALLSAAVPVPKPRRGRSSERLPSREGHAPRSVPPPRRRSRSPPGLRRQHSSPGTLQGAGPRFHRDRDRDLNPPVKRKSLEWKMYVDRPSNRPYWHCPTTGERTWENPYNT